MAVDMHVGGANFEQEVLQSSVPVLVDFWAPWCGPCRAIAPAVEELASEYAGKARVVKVNVDEDPEISSQFGVSSIPALLVFKDGKVVETLVGSRSKPVIAAMIDRAL